MPPEIKKKSYLIGFAAGVATTETASNPEHNPNPNHDPNQPDFAALTDNEANLLDLLEADSAGPSAEDNLGGLAKDPDMGVEAQVQGLCENPPVTILEWPDLDEILETGGSDEDEPALADGPNRDPIFVEQHQAPTFDPIDEPLLTDDKMLEILKMELGDLEDTDEWVDMYTRLIMTRDRTILQFLATQLQTHFSRQTYNDLHHGACTELKIPSEFVAWRHVQILSDLESHSYDHLQNL
ncbi:hypothetical protein FRC11_008577 [Ceratobasidium sp. 423]|nr:hypothetical protein FRC11_008577 [Ceratobasidium sp. 423]